MSIPIERLQELYDREADVLAELKEKHSRYHPINIDWDAERIVSTRLELLEQLIGVASENSSNIPSETTRQKSE